MVLDVYIVARARVMVNYQS